MAILLLGGTGAIGAHLAEILASRGADVVVTSRSRRKDSGNVRYIQGNAQDDHFLSEIISSVRYDVIVDFMAYPSTRQFAGRIKMLLANTDQYVFMSSARVFADSSEAIVEDSPRLLEVSNDKEFLSLDEYALTKARQEDTLKNAGENFTIVRPYITFSEQRLQLGVMEKESWLWRVLQGRSIVVPKALLDKTTTLTYGRDVAECMADLIGNPKAIGQTFNINCGIAMTWGEVLDIYTSTIERVLDRKVKVVVSERDPNLECWTRFQVMYDRYFNRRFDNSKIEGVSNFVFHDPRQKLVECLEVFLHAPHFKGIDWPTEGIRDRIAGEWSPLRDMPTLRDKIDYLRHRLF